MTEQPVLAVAITLNFGRAVWEGHKSMSGESPLFMVRWTTTTFAFSVSSFLSSASDVSGFHFFTSSAARAGGKFCFLFMGELIDALDIRPNLLQLVHLVSGLRRQLPALCPSFAHLKHLPCRSLGVGCFLS